jgi:hypothetical protein
MQLNQDHGFVPWFGHTIMLKLLAREFVIRLNIIRLDELVFAVACIEYLIYAKNKICIYTTRNHAIWNGFLRHLRRFWTVANPHSDGCWNVADPGVGKIYCDSLMNCSTNRRRRYSVGFEPSQQQNQGCKFWTLLRRFGTTVS